MLLTVVVTEIMHNYMQLTPNQPQFLTLYVTLGHKTVISSTGIFVAIANNTVYGLKW